MAKKESKPKKVLKSKIKEAIKPKAPIGRPTKYSQALADKICEQVSISSIGLRKMCTMFPEFPTHESVLLWRRKYPEFSAQYREAKLQQAELFAEDIIDIADDDSGDVIYGENGIVQNSEFIARSRVKIDARKWIACKLLPKVYGDKSEVTNNNVADEELKSSLSEIKSAIDIIAQYEKPY